MNIKNEVEENLIIQARNSIEDYISTINAGLSFVSLVTWENSHKIESAKYSMGRKMTTSDRNSISPNIDVTPDVVIQREENLGYVVEIKKSLPNETNEWIEIANQIIKYDDELMGWWNHNSEMINTQCVVLLIHQTRGRKFTDFFSKYIETKNISLQNKVSIIEFNRSDEGATFYFLRKQYGEILNNRISDKLHEGVAIPIEKVLISYGNQKFCDCEPPCIEYTMNILWQDIFNSEEGRIFDRKTNSYQFEISVNKITKELQKLYGSEGNSHREVEFPKISWVRSAMDAFVDIKLAAKIDDDKYLVYFKKLSGETISMFIKKRKKKKNSTQNEGKQLSLFSENQ